MTSFHPTAYALRSVASKVLSRGRRVLYQKAEIDRKCGGECCRKVAFFFVFLFFYKGFFCVPRSPARFDRLARFAHCTSRGPETLVSAALKPFVSRTKRIACKLCCLVIVTALKKSKRSVSGILDSPMAGFLQHYNDRSATYVFSAPMSVEAVLRYHGCVFSHRL